MHQRNDLSPSFNIPIFTLVLDVKILPVSQLQFVFKHGKANNTDYT